MSLTRIAQYISDILCIALIGRLLVLRLHTVYRVFCAFLIFELFSSSIALLETFLGSPRLDYRVTWLCLRVLAWALSLWTIYALLAAILAKLQGILEFSRWILNITFVLAILIAVATAAPEYSVSGACPTCQPIDRAVLVGLVIERVISMCLLLAILSILAFILWFPVRMPRNLVVFSVGFAIFFATKTSLLLARSYWSPESSRILSQAVALILGACFAYWALFITRGGEATVQIGHSWQAGDRERLMSQLESLNTSLLKTARR